jgi:hypothetical protein
MVLNPWLYFSQLFEFLYEDFDAFSNEFLQIFHPHMFDEFIKLLQGLLNILVNLPEV